MPRDRTARARVRQVLTAQGPVVDPSGYATNALKDAIAYEGSLVAFIQLVAAMERDGEVVREIRGKRTYSIAASSATLATVVREAPIGRRTVLSVAEAPGVVIDVDRLAQAVLRELTRRAAETAPTPELAGTDYSNRIEAARRRVDALLEDVAAPSTPAPRHD